MASQRHRFSLLLLDEGEDYICDWVGFCVPPAGKLDVSPGSTVRGRLRLCSMSLMFDPDEQRLPILKFPFAHIDALERDAAGEAVCLSSNHWMRLRENGVDAPYAHDRSGPHVWRFSLAFASLGALLVRVSRGAASLRSRSPAVARQAAALPLPPAALGAPVCAEGSSQDAGRWSDVRPVAAGGPVRAAAAEPAIGAGDAAAARAGPAGGHPRARLLPAAAQPGRGYSRAQPAAELRRCRGTPPPPAAPDGAGGLLRGA